jgi:hypothetical protein
MGLYGKSREHRIADLDGFLVAAFGDQWAEQLRSTGELG